MDAVISVALEYRENRNVLKVFQILVPNVWLDYGLWALGPREVAGGTSRGESGLRPRNQRRDHSRVEGVTAKRSQFLHCPRSSFNSTSVSASYSSSYSTKLCGEYNTDMLVGRCFARILTDFGFGWVRYVLSKPGKINTRFYITGFLITSFFITRFLNTRFFITQNFSKKQP